MDVPHAAPVEHEINEVLNDCSPQAISEAQGAIREAKAIIRRQQLERLHAAEDEQALAAKAGRERWNMKDGYVEASIHPAFFHYWGRRLGYECWDRENDFFKAFLNQNEACRNINQSRNATVTVAWAPSKKRFHKGYGAGEKRTTNGHELTRMGKKEGKEAAA